MFSFFYTMICGGSAIRGKQIAQYLNGRLNPISGYEKDTCIFLLGHRLDSEPEKSYYDVIDCGTARLSRLRNKVRGGIIATSRTQYGILREFFRRRKMFLIPHHHCNFERFRRPEKEAKVIGCLGGDSAIQLDHSLLKKAFGQMGLDFRFSGYRGMSRESICDFYKDLDIHITYRTQHRRRLLMHMNPLKLNNAGSFGIPSVSFPEPAYKAEWQDSCLWAKSPEELLFNVQRLAADRELYQEYSEKARLKAEEYHIGNIAKLYESLT